jgi:nitroimidazol reductase NimA-like FMN-containing flavoprotein (pyridoxamine 5'-phosphate oxidase superfamily)
MAVSLVMSRDECEAFLADVHIGVVSVSDPERGPLTAPLYYTYEPGGEIRFSTPASSRKGQLLAEGVRVSFLVQKEDMPQAYVSVEGPVTRVEPSTQEAEVEIASRYLGADVAENYVASRKEVRANDPNVIVHIRPERWLSRDFMRQIRAMQEAAAAAAE